MEYVKGLTPHTILFLVDKPERTIAIAPLFAKLKYKLVTAVSLYDCLRMIDQEMPHLIVTDAILTDGNAGNLYDRMQQQAMFKGIPVLVMIAAKTVEQLNPLKGRKFAGFVLGKVDPNALVLKVKEILESYSDVSPFFVRADAGMLTEECTLATNARVVGRLGDQLVCHSDAEVDPDATFLCQPQDKGKGPALLRLGSNVHKGTSIYNLFPVNQVKGSGKVWISILPEINLDRMGKSGFSNRVIFFDPKPERFEQFKRVLSGYDIELIYASNLPAAGALMQRESDGGLGCVYLDELPSNASGISFKEIITKIAEKNRPPVIAATTSLVARSTKEIQYLKKPFGLGTLVEMLDAAIKSRCSFNDAPSLSQEVHYQTPAKLLGLDETGGILQIKFPVVSGNKLLLQHTELCQMWDGNAEVRITSVARVGDTGNLWQAKFESLTAQGSKSRYWEKISRQITEKIASNS